MFHQYQTDKFGTFYLYIFIELNYIRFKITNFLFTTYLLFNLFYYCFE